MLFKAVLTLLFLAVMVVIGVYSRRHSKSVDGFVLGGRSVGPWLSAFAFGTSYFSAVVFVGYAGQFGWKYGLSSTWIGIGNAVIGSLLAWLVLARRTRLMTQHIQSRTMPDFFGTRYDSEMLRVVASIIAFVFLIPYTAGVYMGISKLFELGFGSAIPYEFWAVLMATLTAVYVILGGYKATAINDFLQGLVMLVGITAVIGLVVHHQGGLSAALDKLGAVAPNADDLAQRGKELYANFRPGDFASCFGPAKMSLLGVVVLTSLGTWGLPQMVGKFYSITDEKAIRRGTIISTVFAFVVAGGCYFLGGFGRLYVKTAFNHEAGRFAFDSIIPQMLSGLPEALMALVMLLVLSASMSTLASLVLTSSSTMTLDIIYRDKASMSEEVPSGQIDDSVAAKTERRKVVVMRVLIVFFIVISLMIALRPPHFIAQLMGISWGALAGAFLAPFLLGLYWKGVTRAGVWACFAWGVGLTVVNMLLGNRINPIDCGAIAMVGGFVVVPVASLLSPRLPHSVVERVFACYTDRREEPYLKEKKTCSYCAEGEYLAAFGIKIGELPMSKVYLFKEQSHRGRVIVACRLHVSEITALTPDERDAFFRDVDRVARAVHGLFNPTKVNYGAYGDTGHHLHFHLVPKYMDDEFEWGGVFAMNPKRRYLADAEYDEMVNAYRAALGI